MHIKSNPTFTVFIPTYNRAYILPKALDGLVKQIHKDFEVLIVDDGSSDNTAEVVGSYKKLIDINYIYKPNGGKHTAINIALEKAKGKYFIILDSKEVLKPYALNVFSLLWSSVVDEEISTVMARKQMPDGKIGTPFPTENYISSITDFHFKTGYSLGGSLHGFGDCISCHKTSVIQKYRLPEPVDTKFVPEYYIFDQVGIYNKSLCVNKILCESEYLPDGITCNYDNFVRKNYIGFLYGVINRINTVLKIDNEISLRPKIDVWLTYWFFVSLDTEKKGPRIKKLGLLGWITRVYYMIRTRTISVW